MPNSLWHGQPAMQLVRCAVQSASGPKGSLRIFCSDWGSMPWAQTQYPTVVDCGLHNDWKSKVGGYRIYANSSE